MPKSLFAAALLALALGPRPAPASPALPPRAETPSMSSAALGIQDERYPWQHESETRSLLERLDPPRGFRRIAVPRSSFGAWLRELPVRPGRPDVLLFDGTPKRNQSAHALVLDVDVGNQDLQQCADALIRLRAEYLWSQGRSDDICFRFTSGDLASWNRWRDGWRPRVHGSQVRWERTAPPQMDRASFRAYLQTVFTFAGTTSLARELSTPSLKDRLVPGDVFIEPGFPGHAVLVLDIAEDRSGRRAFLLGQSYMPAQQIQVLRAPGSPESPWYLADPRGPLVTPEWHFPQYSWRRFPEAECGTGSRRALARPYAP